MGNTDFEFLGRAEMGPENKKVYDQCTEMEEILSPVPLCPLALYTARGDIRQAHWLFIQ